MDRIKIFNDPIHGLIEMEEDLVAVIDTPTFQRLRKLKQVGLVEYVYPGATHTRFEHSIGVAHLAGLFCDELNKHATNGETIVDKKNYMCVKLAALCHDLGHGPFSHLFDGDVMKHYGNEEWKHEEGSQKMLDYLLDSDDQKLRKMFKLKHEFVDADFVFVKELILPPPREERMSQRTSEEAFLYEIVSNEETGIDVDKWDYFVRDCHYLGIPNSFEYCRLIKNARVLYVDGESKICYRDKVWPDALKMFQARQTYHRTAYRHRVVLQVDQMVSDALVLANGGLRCFLDANGHIDETVRMSDSPHRPWAYVQLNDSVYDLIQHARTAGPHNFNGTDSDPNGAASRPTAEDMMKLRRAQEILKRVERRDLYRMVGREDMDLQTRTRIRAQGNDFDVEVLGIHREDFVLKEGKLDYGKSGGQFPLDFCYFWKEDANRDPVLCENEDGSKPWKPEMLKKSLVPKDFATRNIMLLYKGYPYDSEVEQHGRTVFKDWWGRAKRAAAAAAAAVAQNHDDNHQEGGN